MVLFESPHRMGRFMEEVTELDPERDMAVCREMTKRFEEVQHGCAGELFELLKARVPRGEFTIVLAAASEEKDA